MWHLHGSLPVLQLISFIPKDSSYFCLFLRFFYSTKSGNISSSDETDPAPFIFPIMSSPDVVIGLQPVYIRSLSKLYLEKC